MKKLFTSTIPKFMVNLFGYKYWIELEVCRKESTHILLQTLNHISHIVSCF